VPGNGAQSAAHVGAGGREYRHLDGQGNYDTSWYNTTDHSFTISTAAELAGLAAIVNGAPAGLPDKFTGKTVTLAADVDLAGHDWTPIGETARHLFCRHLRRRRP
jgi:hypothetical protein